MASHRLVHPNALPLPGVAGPLLLAALAGLLGAQVLLPTAPQGGVAAPALAALELVAGAWVLITLLQVALDLRRPPATVAAYPRSWAGAAPLAVAVATSLLIAVLTFPAAGRLTVTLLSYLPLALALGWVVLRRAGALPATRAVLALSVFAVVAAGADVRPGPRIREADPGSPYHWVAGFPTAAWAVRHEVRPPGPLPARPLALRVPLAAPYDGPARVYATLNGADLGPARLVDRNTVLQVDLPPDLLSPGVSGASGASGAPASPDSRRLVFELRQRPPDPRMRLIAHRWGQAATAGPGASSYFDGSRWWPGTFNDARGEPRPGIYVLQLDPR